MDVHPAHFKQTATGAAGSNDGFHFVYCFAPIHCAVHTMNLPKARHCSRFSNIQRFAETVLSEDLVCCFM